MATFDEGPAFITSAQSMYGQRTVSAEPSWSQADVSVLYGRIVALERRLDERASFRWPAVVRYAWSLLLTVIVGLAMLIVAASAGWI